MRIALEGNEKTARQMLRCGLQMKTKSIKMFNSKSNLQ